MPRNLFRMSLKELKEWQAKLHSMPGYHYQGEDLSPEGLEKKLIEQMNYVVYQRNVPCPMEDVEPGVTIYDTLDNGLRVVWLNGTLYVRRDILEKYKSEHPEEE